MLLLRNMFAVIGDCHVEIFEYNTTTINFLQNLGNFTNSLKKYVNFPEIINSFFSIFFQIKSLS